jgi:titin
VSGNTVTVSWTAPSSGTPTNYLAQVGTSPGASNIFSGSVGLASSASGVLPNGTYYLRLFAQNAVGTSPASAEAVVTVGAPAVPPGPPRNLAGSSSGNMVSVSWSAPASGGAVGNYLAQVGTTPGGSDVFTGSIGLATSASGVLGPGTYYIRIFAQNAAGTSLPSNELSVTVGGGCSVPAAPVLTGAKSGNVVSIAWTTPSGGPVTHYTVQAGSSSGSSGYFNGSVGLVNAVSAQVGNGPYFIRVVANAACGSSGASNEVSLAIP